MSIAIDCDDGAGATGDPGVMRVVEGRGIAAQQFAVGFACGDVALRADYLECGFPILRHGP
jgi:hypothetical protein